jgi:very-short-patch-repair endonuclease
MEPALTVKARARRSGAIPTSERGERLAPRLRSNATPAEKKLWVVLRKLDLNGTHFRRQAPFGPYVVDFVCHRARLIVEVDGGIHRHPAVTARDAEREAWLSSRGYTVIRITNQDALFDPAGVATRIAGLIGLNTPNSTPAT